MPVDARILDSYTGQVASVNKFGAVCVSDTPPSQPEGLNRYTAYNALLGSAGAVETGISTANLNVNGSATAQEFYIGAEANIDIRIMKVVIIVADTSVIHNRFGNVTALTNGFDLQVFERGITTNLISEAATGGQLIAQSGLTGAYGNAATSFELTNWSGTADAQTVVFDVASVVPGGIRLAHGSEDKIFGTVRDNLTGLEEFTVRIIGYRHHA